MAPWRIVALGKTAEKALTLLRYNFYVMSHPSGLNRQLNDPKFVEEKIKGLREYLKPSEEELFNPELSCSQDQ
jgi:uracil-DNA glycosylase